MDDLSRIERMYGSVNEYNRCQEEYYEDDSENIEGYNIGEMTAYCHCDDLGCKEYRIYKYDPMFPKFICPHEKCTYDGVEYGIHFDNTVD